MGWRESLGKEFREGFVIALPTTWYEFCTDCLSLSLSLCLFISLFLYGNGHFTGGLKVSWSNGSTDVAGETEANELNDLQTFSGNVKCARYWIYLCKKTNNRYVLYMDQYCRPQNRRRFFSRTYRRFSAENSRKMLHENVVRVAKPLVLLSWYKNKLRNKF